METTKSPILSRDGKSKRETQEGALLELAAGALMRLADRHNVEIVRCVRGSVWVTRQGDKNDYLLRSGDSLMAGRSRLTVVESLTESVILLENPRY